MCKPKLIFRSTTGTTRHRSLAQELTRMTRFEARYEVSVAQTFPINKALESWQERVRLMIELGGHHIDHRLSGGKNF
jgi:hypothetical protein